VTNAQYKNIYISSLSFNEICILLHVFCHRLHCVVLEWWTVLLRIREVPGSNFGLDTGFPDWDFCSNPQTHYVNAWIEPWIKPRPLPSISLPVHHSLITLSFHALFSELLTNIVKQTINNNSILYFNVLTIQLQGQITESAQVYYVTADAATTTTTTTTTTTAVAATTANTAATRSSSDWMTGRSRFDPL
jgi:hypothetical protein